MVHRDLVILLYTPPPISTTDACKRVDVRELYGPTYGGFLPWRSSAGRLCLPRRGHMSLVPASGTCYRPGWGDICAPPVAEGLSSTAWLCTQTSRTPPALPYHSLQSLLLFDFGGCFAALLTWAGSVVVVAIDRARAHKVLCACAKVAPRPTLYLTPIYLLYIFHWCACCDG